MPTNTAINTLKTPLVFMRAKPLWKRIPALGRDKDFLYPCITFHFQHLFATKKVNMKYATKVFQ